MADNLPANRNDSNPDEIIIRDGRGHRLTHYVLAERLLQVEYSLISEEIRSEPSSETLTYILEGGFRGFHKYTTQELLDEWAEVEPKFWTLVDDDSMPWETYEEDPLSSLPKEVEGHPV
jgi:hypothetical protein|tara:strand:- start:894 stop:1250 length:357 start_codon:yes stop_codon:yes gene_type:complete